MGLARWTRFVLRHRRVVLGFWLAVVIAGGFASFKLPPLLSNSFTVPGTASEQARQILQKQFGDRPDGTFTVVFQVPDVRSRALRARLQLAVDRTARAVPGARPTALLTAGRHVALRGDRVDAQPRPGQARDRGGARGTGRSGRGRACLCHRRRADAARSRPDLLARPDEGGEHRVAGCPGRSGRGLRLLGGRDDAVHLRGVHDHRRARGHVLGRPADRDADVRDEPDRARRPRDRDRLLAARRLPLSRGARADGRHRGGGRSHDGDRRPSGALLGRGRRNRAADPDCAAAAVHAADGDRRLPDPARLGARRRDAAADAARAVRPPRRGEQALSPPCGRPGARVLGVARAVDHAQAAALSDRRLGAGGGARRSRVLAGADAGLVDRRTALPGSDPRLRPAVEPRSVPGPRCRRASSSTPAGPEVSARHRCRRRSAVW